MPTIRGPLVVGGSGGVTAEDAYQSAQQAIAAAAAAEDALNAAEAARTEAIAARDAAKDWATKTTDVEAGKPSAKTSADAAASAAGSVLSYALGTTAITSSWAIDSSNFADYDGKVVEVNVAGGDVTLTLKADAYKVSGDSSRRKYVEFDIRRGGTSNKLIVTKDNPAPTAAPAITNSGHYGNMDANTTADTSGEFFIRTLPTQSCAANAGTGRILFFWVGFATQTGQAHTGFSLSATVGGNAATIQKNFLTSLTGNSENIGCGYRVLPDSGSNDSHDLIVDLGQAVARGSQWIMWAVLSGCDTASPVENLTSNHDGTTLTPADGANWKNEITVSRSGDYRTVLTAHSWERSFTQAVTTATGTQVINDSPEATPSGQTRASLQQLVRTYAGTGAGSTTHKTVISNAATQAALINVGFAVKPAATGAALTLMDAQGNSQTSINVTDDTVIRFYSNGTTFKVIN